MGSKAPGAGPLPANSEPNLLSKNSLGKNFQKNPFWNLLFQQPAKDELIG